MFNRIENRIVRKGLKKIFKAINTFTDTPEERMIIAHKMKGVLNYIDTEKEQKKFAELLADVIPTPFVDGTEGEIKLYQDAIEAIYQVANTKADIPLIKFVENINVFLQKLEAEIK